LKQSHARGWKPLFLTVSFVGTDELILEAGEDAEGMVITQVVPPYYMTDLKTRGAVPAHAVEIYAFGAAEFREF
jgi:hypothetical protein